MNDKLAEFIAKKTEEWASQKLGTAAYANISKVGQPALEGEIVSGSDVRVQEALRAGSATQDDIPDGTIYKQFSATQETKLTGIATGATANSTDGYLLSRENHTGAQSSGTISDLFYTMIVNSYMFN
jgi:hypothetical protein